MKTKLFVCSPAFNGKVNIQFALSLSELYVLAQKNNVDIETKITASGSLLAAERNRLLEDFWKSDCTHILCIDSDLGFPGEAVFAMLKENKEFIAGVYPARQQGDQKFLVIPEMKEGDTVVSDRHLIKALYIPAGFMLLTKEAIKKMREKHSKDYCVPKDESRKTEAFMALFNTEVYEGEFWGEDYVFCRKAREAGIEIWVDTLVEFDHDGIRGMLYKNLKKISQDEKL